MPKSQKKKKSVKKKSVPLRKKVVASKGRNTQQSLETVEEEALTEETNLTKITEGIEKTEFEIEDLADVSEERASIISIVKGLEGQVETAFKLKEVLEDELDSTRQKLSEEMDARAQLEVQVNSLQAQQDLAEQLRQDISFAEEERNKFADELVQTRQELEEIIAERDSFIEQFNCSHSNVKELEDEKMALEAQVMNLKDKIVEAENLRKELAEMLQSHRQLREQVHDLTRRLETTENSKNVLEKQLAGALENVKNLRGEADQLRRKVANGENRTTDLRILLEDQQAANRDLVEANTSLENEIKNITINYEAIKGELDTFKNALRDIRSEATRTSGRVRQKYLKPGNSGQKTKNNSRSRLQTV